MAHWSGSGSLISNLVCWLSNLVYCGSLIWSCRALVRFGGSLFCLCSLQVRRLCSGLVALVWLGGALIRLYRVGLLLNGPTRVRVKGSVAVPVITDL